MFSQTFTSLAPPSGWLLWLGGAVSLWALYTLVFVQTGLLGWAAGMEAAWANVLPLAILAAAIHAILRAGLMKRGVAVQTVVHLALAPTFALTWYALVIVLEGFQGGWTGNGFAVRPFTGPAFTWQCFQGLVLYATITATCYAIRGGREAASLTIVSSPPLERYLTRSGDEIMPVDVAEIVSITGAQDYSEVATRDGRRHLVRMSLGEFERRLDANRFLRVHRSVIVAFPHLSRAEPAGGGRMLAHLANGDIVQVSRAGSQLLRSFIV